MLVEIVELLLPKRIQQFCFTSILFLQKQKHISRISRQIVLGWKLNQLREFSWICVHGLPHTQLMLFTLQVFLPLKIVLIAEIIIIATRCLIRWEWQNFHRPYSRKNFPRLSSHKKRHKLTPHILLKTKFMNILE